MLSAANRDRKRGFTLIELMVVVAIIGIALMVTYPRVSGLILGRKLMGFCAELAGTLDYVRSRAVTDGLIYYFYLDKNKNAYQVTREGREGEEPMEGRLGKGRHLPEGIFLKRIEVDTETLTRLQAPIRFYPRGNADEANIYLETTARDRATIWVKPYTGRSEVFNYFK